MEGVTENDDDDDDDEEFCTPKSTPGSDSPQLIPPAAAAAAATTHAPRPDPRTADGGGVTEAMLIKKMYDRYRVSMNGMQVILGKVKDNWKYAHLKGVSTLHVLDKFSISLACERRIVQTSDPNWPSIVISGTFRPAS